MGSWYAGQQINTLGSSGGGTGHVELSVFRCLESTAMIAIGGIVVLGLARGKWYRPEKWFVDVGGNFHQVQIAYKLYFHRYLNTKIAPSKVFPFYIFNKEKTTLIFLKKSNSVHPRPSGRVQRD